MTTEFSLNYTQHHSLATNNCNSEQYFLTYFTEYFFKLLITDYSQN